MTRLHIIRGSKWIVISTEDCGPQWSNFRLPRWNMRLFVRRSLLNLIASRLRSVQKKARMGIGLSSQNVDHRFFSTVVEWSNEDSNQSWYIWEFDQWVVSRTYRERFLHEIGMDFDKLPDISTEGGGSSFSGLKERPNPEEIINRYQKVDFSIEILLFFRDPQIHKMLSPSEQVFIEAGLSKQLNTEVGEESGH